MSRWQPYVDNGGTALALSGKGYAIIAADRRLSSGYSIMSRESPKIVQLTNKTVLASCGMQSDRSCLHSVLKARMHTYKLNHGKEMSTRAISHMLSRTLYYRRFFPYYTFNLLAGIEENGEGYVYSYDAIGSFEEERCACTGSGALLTMPMLDNQVKKQHQSKTEKQIDPDSKNKYPIIGLTKDEALQLVKDILNGVVERDIKTGDSADIYVLTPKGTQHIIFKLRQD